MLAGRGRRQEPRRLGREFGPMRRSEPFFRPSEAGNPICFKVTQGKSITVVVFPQIAESYRGSNF